MGSRIHREVYVRFRGEDSETCCCEAVRRRILSLHTLPVVAIHEQMEDFIRFETAKAEYHLSLSPFPGAASAMLPAKLAMAA